MWNRMCWPRTLFLKISSVLVLMILSLPHKAAHCFTLMFYCSASVLAQWNAFSQVALRLCQSIQKSTVLPNFMLQLKDSVKCNIQLLTFSSFIFVLSFFCELRFSLGCYWEQITALIITVHFSALLIQLFVPEWQGQRVNEKSKQTDFKIL